MKFNKLLLALFPLVLSGCNYNKTLVLSFVINYHHIADSETGEFIPTLLLDNSYWEFPSEINIDYSDVIAGDELKITFNGNYKYICTLSNPGKCKVEGKIKDYSIVKTSVKSYYAYEGLTIEELIEDVKRENILKNEYVILENGHYISLDEYDRQTIYLSVDLKKTSEMCNCPKNAHCSQCATYIAAMYAFNPRSNE